MEEYYLWLKSLHLFAVFAWMAGLFYLPRIFVYHCSVEIGSNEDKVFQTMELKLLRIIMNPAMIIAILSGLILAHIYGFKNLGIWFHVKFAFVIALLYFHHFLARRRKDFLYGNNKLSAKFFRIINEVPTLCLAVIIVMVIVKPF